MIETLTKEYQEKLDKANESIKKHNIEKEKLKNLPVISFII